MDYNRIIIRCSVLYIFRSAPGTRRKIKARMHSCMFQPSKNSVFVLQRNNVFLYRSKGHKKNKPRPTSKIKFPFFQSFDVGYKYDFPYLTFDWFFFLWNFWTWYINCPPTFYYQDTNVRISHIRNAFSTLQTFAKWIEINAGHNMYKTPKFFALIGMLFCLYISLISSSKSISSVTNDQLQVTKHRSVLI